MDQTRIKPASSTRFWLGALLLLLSATTLSCQVNINQFSLKWNGFVPPREALAEASATLAATATATPVPTAAITVLQGAREMEEASKIVPVPKVTMPRGPRRQPPAHLIIPSIGVDAKVIPLNTRYNEKGELVWETAPFAAGHHAGTANPGEQGNLVISGHMSSTREGAVFNRLPELNIGDGVVVGTSDNNYLYRVVDKQVVEPTQTEVMESTGEEVLTLMTCVPDGVYSHRLVITAKRV